MFNNGISCTGYLWRKSAWYIVLRPGGNYHCYNVVGDCVFDLTSEQFGDEKLDYTDNPEQYREVHFTKEEKRLRYEYLRNHLLDVLNRK